MPSPLFPNFGRLLASQKQALLNLIQQKAKQPDRSSGPMKHAGTGGGIWNSIIKKMGPWGGLVDSLFRGLGKRIEADIANELAKAIESEQVNRPGEVPLAIRRELIEEKPIPGPLSDWTRPPTKPPSGRTISPVEEPGKPREPEIGRRTEPPKAPPTHDQPEAIEETADGKLVEWVMVTRSSNVFAFAYEWNPRNAREPGNLLVKFLGGDSKHRSGPGAMYRYFDVNRSVFVAFKMAASKGGFVWDELRIRGTVSGHQYSYALAGTGPSGYIPRQAVVAKRGRVGRGAFVRRTFEGRQSNLQEREFKGTRNITKDFRGEASRIRLRGR